jgi:hypothetical protein
MLKMKRLMLVTPPCTTTRRRRLISSSNCQGSEPFTAASRHSRSGRRRHTTAPRSRPKSISRRIMLPRCAICSSPVKTYVVSEPRSRISDHARGKPVCHNRPSACSGPPQAQGLISAPRLQQNPPCHRSRASAASPTADPFHQGCPTDGAPSSNLESPPA